MRSMGIVRKMDELGRVVIPKEARRAMGLDVSTPMEIFIDLESKKITLSPYAPGCTFCGNVGNLAEFRGHKVCSECAQHLAGK
jgi:AbrB family transcriptional regulator, transcriptional pleiotropic regulator of transition state genes